jgi:cell division protein FtsA
MAKSHFIVGLDIGTNNIKVLVVSKNPKETTLQVLAQSEVQNEGMRKGVVINVGQVSQKIREALDICKDSLGKKINSVIVNINGSHLAFMPSRGLASVSRADQSISESDVERTLQASRSISLSSNQEILEVFPQEFIIDGQPGVKEVLGLRGIRLEAKTLCLVAFSPYFKNLSEAILEANIEAENIIPSVLASSAAVLSQKEKELGVAVVEIGAGNTGLAVFQEDTLIHSVVFPLGSNNITNDIAIVFRVDVDEAERIKREFSGFGLKGSSGKEKKGKFSQKTLTRVVEAREREILGEINKELKKIDKNELPAGIVLTGGGVKIPRFIDFAKRELKLPCRIGLTKGFTPEIDDPAWATVAGLVLEGAKSFEEKGTIFSDRGILGKIKRIIKTFIP